MNHLEHAQVYLDLPKEMQDEDALTFARDVVTLYGLLDKYKAENERLRGGLAAAEVAARALSALIADLGAFLDDSDPRLMALAGPIGKAEADLWLALGMDTVAHAAAMQEDIANRCAVCGWTLAASVREGCVRGNCSLRPRPTVLYAPERAATESAAYFATKDPTP